MDSCRLKFKFQGGFVGCVAIVSLEDSNSQSIYKNCFYPDDINDMQTFMLNDKADVSDGKALENVKKLSILFEKSSDFFGRIIIYHFELLA